MAVAEILKRIGFTERWLRRARAECEEGALLRGLLTLSLAEAEIRRARELGAAAVAKGETGRRVASPGWRLAPAAIGIFSALFVMLLGIMAVPQSLHVGAPPMPEGTDGGWSSLSPRSPALVFEKPVGTILAMVQVAPDAPSAPPAPAAAAPARVSPRGSTIAVHPVTRPSAPPASAPPVSQLLTGAPAPLPVAAAPVAHETSVTARTDAAVEGAAPPRIRVSADGGELIDLVLVAERTLRGSRF